MKTKSLGDLKTTPKFIPILIIQNQLISQNTKKSEEITQKTLELETKLNN